VSGAGSKAGNLKVDRTTPPRLIDRVDLLAALDCAAAGRLTIISAPAGSGKTSLLRAWADRSGQAHRLVMLRVQRDQRDAQQFWLALVRRPVHSLRKNLLDVRGDVGVQRGRDNSNIRAMRPRLEGPSDSQIYRVTEAKLFVPAIWLRVRNTTAPSCATSGRRVPSHVATLDLQALVPPAGCCSICSKRGAFYTTARTVAQVRRGCERTGSRSLLMNCS
jgi:hypothetical protein